MTTWECDQPPSSSTSMVAGCIIAGAARAGDFSSCTNECSPPPTVVVIVPEGVGLTVINEGGN